MNAITLNDVHAAAAAHGLSPINALTAMQQVAAAQLKVAEAVAKLIK